MTPMCCNLFVNCCNMWCANVESCTILAFCWLDWNPSWFRWTTGIIWTQVRELDRFGDRFCTCALIIWTVLLHCVRSRPMQEGKAGRGGWVASRPSVGRKRKRSWANSGVGLDRGKEKFFKRKSYPIYRALKIDQIQMKFEFNLKQPRPTLNQK